MSNEIILVTVITLLYLWLGIGVGKLEAGSVPPLKVSIWIVLFWPIMLITFSFTSHKNNYRC